MRLATCCYGSCALVLFLQLILLWVGMHASPKFREAITTHRSGGRRPPPHMWTPGVHDDEPNIIEPAPNPEVLQARRAPNTAVRPAGFLPDNGFGRRLPPNMSRERSRPTVVPTGDLASCPSGTHPVHTPWGGRVTLS